MKQLKISKQITNRESESLNRYLIEIGKMDLVTTEEEVNLAKRIREGDTVALEKLTKANLRFVVSVAKQYQHRGMSLCDLINEGNVGLIKAGSRFDETRGFKFISYAVWWIRQSIIQALAGQSRMVRLPLNRVGSITKISKAQSDLEQIMEREPTAEELGAVLGETPDYINENIKVAQRTISFDAPSIYEEHATLLETIADSQSVSPDFSLLRAALQVEIQRVLSTIPPRERKVLLLYFGLDNHLPHTLEEIGKKLSLTRERVRQIKEHAITEMRKSFRSSGLKSYLG